MKSTIAGFSFIDVVRTMDDELVKGTPGEAKPAGFSDDFFLLGAPPNGRRFYRIRVGQ